MGKRYDKKHRLLRTGETERADGYYTYRWTSRDGKRHSVTAGTLEELRAKEEEIRRDVSDGIRVDSQNIMVNDLFELWKHLKRGLKDNTYQNYCYMYTQFVAEDIGKFLIRNLKRSDIKRFYNKLVDERGLKIATIDNIHTVLHQVLELAVEDNYVRNNVSDNLLKELKQTHHFEDEHKRALTVAEQELFLEFLASEKTQYHHWYPIFAVMVGTGMRVGEICGLRWEDVDVENGIIDVNHTLVYYNHAVNGCYFNIHTPKTKAGKRQIPMLDEVKESIMNAYEIKTGLNRTKISHLMDAESWFNAKKAVELGFADEILFDKEKEENPEEKEEEKEEELEAILFSRSAVTNSFFNKLIPGKPEKKVNISELEKRLSLLKP